ncbi:MULTISPECIES: SAF domain-containing protein [Nocardiopsis]|uniref:SAF domain-containing protein n=1 Tax=Nocardiopsis lambiniae TaxID=3075539 RepID=A0ABU2MEQ0_9ACTN|nr:MULTISPECIES: SAF domain-containing protein [unclassified Nocardiopsis]MDE3721975.1 SAF domain-containing protein [Nocardiopsis sp. N85]MDT0331178.1 SAF domain-containing protein [Nocardiopsis sp. DSM 44743]
MVETTTAPPPGAGRQTQHTPAVRLSGGGGKRWRWLVLALTLTTAGALSGVIALERLDDRTGIVVADADLPAGHVLTMDDLRVSDMSVSADISFVAASRLEEVVGQTLTLPVSEGGVLPESALGADAEFPEAERALVGAVLTAGNYPSSLGSGAAVSVVVNGEEQSEAGPQAYLALVRSLTPDPGVEGAIVVELLVSSADAARIASASSAGRISLVQVHPRGGA